MRPATIGPRRFRRVPRRQRGIVVFVALIAVVLMSLAAVALMRSTHTSTLVVGNLAFRQAAMALSTAAVETAVYDMFPPTQTLPTLFVHNLAFNYYASVQPGENALGIPAALQSVGAFTGAKVLGDPTGNNAYTARYIIERMCSDARLGLAADRLECEMIPPKQSQASQGEEIEDMLLPRIPFYRLTVRVDGPNNSVTFSQAMLR